MFNYDIIMTDIIIINRNVFSDRKATIMVGDIIKSKYEEIYKTFQCFTANAFIAPLIINKIHEDNHKGFKGNRNFKQRPERREESYFSNKKKDLHKIVLGIFNVLNHDNYNKMLSKIRFLKNETNIIYIINDLLNKCALQIFYINIYIKFLHDIVTLCTPQERLLVIDCFNTYIKGYIDQSDWINGKIVDSCADYNAFCDSQKRKSIILAKNMILCHLFNLYDELEFTIEDYINHLINDLKKICFSDAKTDNEEYNCILIVQMIIDMIKSFKKYNNTVDLQILVDSFDDIEKTLNNKKLKFLLEDLAKLI